jgi:hypothetical protein
MSALLKTILEYFEEMNTLGFTCSTPEGAKTIRIKLLFCVFDLVAKAKVLNMQQFSGAYGCPCPEIAI